MDGAGSLGCEMDDIDKEAIEREAIMLRNQVWRSREQFVPIEPRGPLQRFEPDEATTTGYKVRLIHPSNAARFLGFVYLEVASLGKFSDAIVAGKIDRNARTILISQQVSREQQLFTGAHELGHAVLHRGLHLHRDRPISEPSAGDARRRRPQVEREADFFGACYIMPNNLVEREFVARFGSNKLRLNDSVAWALDHNDPDRLLQPHGWLDVEKAVSRVANYNGTGLPPLHHVFNVSVTAMAMRLQELKLIEPYAA